MIETKDFAECVVFLEMCDWVSLRSLLSRHQSSEAISGLLFSSIRMGHAEGFAWLLDYVSERFGEKFPKHDFELGICKYAIRRQFVDVDSPIDFPKRARFEPCHPENLLAVLSLKRGVMLTPDENGVTALDYARRWRIFDFALALEKVALGWSGFGRSGRAL